MVTGPEDAMAAPPGGHGRMRASDADREQVIDVLKAAFVQGRLHKDELDARAGQAFASRTYAELAAVTADIPAVPAAVQPLRERARPEADASVAQVVLLCASAIVAAELFLVLAIFAFPVYGTLDIAVLANLVGLPLAGGLMYDTWRASRSRGHRPRDHRPSRQGPRAEGPRGQGGAATCSTVSRTARPTVIRVSARPPRMSGPRPGCGPAAHSERRTAAESQPPEPGRFLSELSTRKNNFKSSRTTLGSLPELAAQQDRSAPREPATGQRRHPEAVPPKGTRCSVMAGSPPASPSPPAY
jgi:Domain of unknown function (DUF1707)